MRETRTWEQMKSDNKGAAWINDRGEFCTVYERDIIRDETSKESTEYEWQSPGFNGCWSCMFFDICEQRLANMPVFG